MRIGITGATGLLGFHLRAYALRTNFSELVLGTRAIFGDAEEMNRFLSACDVVIHLAGLAHGSDTLVEETNVGLARTLVEGLAKRDPVPVVFASTLQIDRDSAYGRSKRKAGEILSEWGARAGVPVATVVIPNVFGEFAKPNHNSVIATFCHQLITGADSRVDHDVSVRLMHAQDVAQKLMALAQKPLPGVLRLQEGSVITVRELYDTLAHYKIMYDAGVLPAFPSLFERRLFNVYRSHLPYAWYPRALELRGDDRGGLFEVVRTYGEGQAFVSTTRPGGVRGNHWHERKFERFCVLSGEAEMKVRPLFSRDTHTFHLSGTRPVFVDTQTFVVHNLINTGKDELTTLFWASEPHDANNPDTYPEFV